VNLEHVCIHECEQLLDLSLSQGQFGDDCFAEKHVFLEIIDNCIQMFELESKSEVRVLTMNTHDSFELGSKEWNNGHRLLKSRHNMVGKLIDNALQVFIKLFIQDTYSVSVFQVFLKEFKELVTDLAVNKQS